MKKDLIDWLSDLMEDSFVVNYSDRIENSVIRGKWILMTLPHFFYRGY